MARRKQVRKPKLAASEPPDPDLLAHIKSLAVGSVDEYRRWCERHGFSRRLDKHWRERTMPYPEWMDREKVRHALQESDQRRWLGRL